MDAGSGGWENTRPLPNGTWTITEDPSGNRNYFGLFLNDNKINDQFQDNKKWRDGIRFGYHDAIIRGSHGCIMTHNSSGQTYEEGKKTWTKAMNLIRSRPAKIITYTNNENPRRRDDIQYKIRSYGTLKVVD